MEHFQGDRRGSGFGFRKLVIDSTLSFLHTALFLTTSARSTPQIISDAAIPLRDLDKAAATILPVVSFSSFFSFFPITARNHPAICHDHSVSSFISPSLPPFVSVSRHSHLYLRNHCPSPPHRPHIRSANRQPFQLFVVLLSLHCPLPLTLIPIHFHNFVLVTPLRLTASHPAVSMPLFLLSPAPVLPTSPSPPCLNHPSVHPILILRLTIHYFFLLSVPSRPPDAASSNTVHVSSTKRRRLRPPALEPRLPQQLLRERLIVHPAPIRTTSTIRTNDLTYVSTTGRM
ncbi:hypothetical protein BGW80DRAFT_820838 [Lactifluus volemus]|nr:hypothetical protein BGW80DRAFT_820838 [Lactifluus volemus]